MSLSGIPWNHFDPLNQFPPRPDSTAGFYPQYLSSSAFFSHGLPQLSSVLYGENPAFFNMNALSAEEMERFQKLSNEFEAELPVGNHAATFAKAWAMG